MKKICNLSILLGFLFVWNLSPARAQHEQQPAPDRTIRANETNSMDSALLFEISGNGLEKPSYLFGTFHIVCAGDMIQAEKLNAYVDKTERLFLEIDFDDPAELQAAVQMIFLDGDKKIKDVLSKEQFAKIDLLVKNSLGAPLEKFNSYKPAVLGVMVLTAPQTIGCEQTDSYDLALFQYAGLKNKPIEGLEKAAAQGKALDSIPLEKQAQDLYEIALAPEKSFSEFKRMIEIYKAQDAGRIFKFMEAQLKADALFQTNLLDERNLAWIPKIERAAREKSTFFAFGAGHLGGETGVLKLLREKGYLVKPIKL